MICKLLEHIICSHILTFLDNNNLLTPLQHGFRRGHSCESQLLLTVSDFVDTFDTKTQTDVGVLDFSRAFDTVPHERLLGKLAHYGIQGQTNEWIRAFLSGRRMQVVVEGESSSTAPVVSGVPQGTVLGPLLFLLYINDMPQVVSEGTSTRLFADDCLIYRSIHSIEDQISLQKDLHQLQKWTEVWGMQFNPAKCQTMNISRGSPQTKYYELCGEILTTVTSAKYLGVTISDDLEWHNQVCSMAKSANSTLHLIARNLHNCTRSTRALAYTSLVRPKMEYCASVWDPYTKKDIETLERINRKAARVVYNKSYRDKDVSPTKLIADLGWKTLAERREQQRLTMIYRIVNGLIAIPPTHLSKPIREGTRGHSKKFQELGAEVDPVKFSFYPRTIRQWNSKLREETVSAQSIDSFKTSLSSYY